MNQIKQKSLPLPSIQDEKRFPDLVERYMNQHSRIHKVPKSVLRDKASFGHMSDYFGDRPLTELTPRLISDYKSARRGTGIKPATLSRELEVLRHALNLAIREWEWLEHNPFEKVKIERVNNKVERWLTSEEEQKLLEASPDWLRDIIIFALNTGMRQDEMLSLKWAQVDGARRTAILLHTKNKEKRTIPLNKTVLAILASKFKGNDPSEYVFASPSGEKFDARNLLRAYFIARKKAKLEDVRWHDLRHTFATRLVQSGVDLYV